MKQVPGFRIGATSTRKARPTSSDTGVYRLHKYTQTLEEVSETRQELNCKPRWTECSETQLTYTLLDTCVQELLGGGGYFEQITFRASGCSQGTGISSSSR